MNIKNIYFETKRQGGNGIGGKTTRVWGQMTRGKRLGAKFFLGEMSCYHHFHSS